MLRSLHFKPQARCRSVAAATEQAMQTQARRQEECSGLLAETAAWGHFARCWRRGKTQRRRKEMGLLEPGERVGVKGMQALHVMIASMTMHT